MTAPRSTRVHRTDIGTLRPVERRPDGTIRVDAYLSKCGVFQYRQPDGSVRRELRLPEDVFDQASLRSFEGVPVTNDHPPGMLDAKNARQFQVGSSLSVPTADDDHMRGRLSVVDHATIAAMEAGKTQVSNGYVCDCVETPGVHPQYGIYDAIQKNIRGNHVAIVDRARAGITASARMDGWMVVEPGTEVAVDARTGACNSRAMATPATARVEVIVKHDTEVDPGDEANRNAAGDNNAPPTKKRQPGAMADKGGDQGKPVDPEADPDDDDDDDDEDGPVDSMYDAAGKLTPFGKSKVAAASFAIPGKQKLPIHDPKSVKDSMKAFAKHEFDDADEKHAAFNRISGKAKQFGMDTASFVNKHGGNLDRADGANKDTDMTPQEIKDLQEKADKRKEKLVAAKAKIDSLEADVAKKDGEIASLTKDLEAAKKAPKTDSADEVTAKVDAKVELLAKAGATGAKVDSKMTDRAIKIAVVKHVDGDDVAADKADAYVDALYDGALKRADKDAASTAKGANALAAARVAAANPAAHADEDDTSEDAAKARLQAANRNQWSQPRTK